MENQDLLAEWLQHFQLVTEQLVVGKNHSNLKVK